MKLNRRDIIISIVAFSGILIYSYILNVNNKNKRDRIYSNRGLAVGVIVEYHKWGVANRGAEFEFWVDSILYNGKTSNAPSFKNCLKDSLCLGKKFIVEYWKTDPHIHRILFNEPVYTCSFVEDSELTKKNAKTKPKSYRVPYR